MGEGQWPRLPFAWSWLGVLSPRYHSYRHDGLPGCHALNTTVQTSPQLSPQPLRTKSYEPGDLTGS